MSQMSARFSVTFLLATALAVLAGCSNGTMPAATTTTTTTTTAAPTLTVSLVDFTTGAATSTISSGVPANAKATLLDATGAAVPNTVVTYTTDATLATMTPVTGTALTNASGVATIRLDPASISAAGAGTITATAQVTIPATATAAATTAAVTGSTGYTIGASTLTLSAPCFGPCTPPGYTTGGTYTSAATALSAFGSAAVYVTVSSGGALITSSQVVTFYSPCAVTGKAFLTASTTTVNGVATGSYHDNGCANSDPITASVGSLTTPTSTTIVVNPPSAGSIQFVSATPTTISLAGTGGTTSSQVVFKVVDGGGNPVSGIAVYFGLNTTLGGITLTPAITSPPAVVTSDSSGLVNVNVNAGTFATAVRVSATACTTGFVTPLTVTPTCKLDPITGIIGNQLSTQSSQLIISTGLPAQDSFSLSATTHNIEGWNYDGVTTVITARAADHFHNPVPDGTAVYFTTEGGSIGSTSQSCTTLNGSCTTTLTSQNPRPASANNGYGRVTVLAYAVGEEAFIDLNSNGTVDNAAEMIDINGLSTDMGEAYRDDNENGVHNVATEPYVDFNGDGIYNGTTTGVAPFNFVGATSSGDALYNGVLCTLGAPICSTQKSIDVRANQVIIFSASSPASYASLLAASVIEAGLTPAVVELSAPITPPPLPTGTLTAGTPTTGIVLASCTTVTPMAQSVPANVTVTVVDLNGNAMPAGTTIKFAASNGSIPTPASWVVPDTIGCRSGFPGCPASAASPTFGDIQVSLISDAAWGGGTTCTNAQSGGIFTVTVTSPKGLITTYTMGIAD